MLPLIKPALIVTVIFSFTWTWNDFLTPLIYLGAREKYTLTLGLRYFQSQYGMRYIRELMATSIIFSLSEVFCERNFYKWGKKIDHLPALNKMKRGYGC